MPVVLNRHHFLPTVGCGPGDKTRKANDTRPELPSPWIYVGRGTSLGNPYTVKTYGAQAIPKYLEHLRELVRRRDREIMNALRSITDDTHLVCSCWPRPCHANIIDDAWTKMRDAGML